MRKIQFCETGKFSNNTQKDIKFGYFHDFFYYVGLYAIVENEFGIVDYFPFSQIKFIDKPDNESIKKYEILNDSKKSFI